MRKKKFTEPIQLTLEEDDVPARVYKSWYTPNDDVYPKVVNSASHPPATVHHAFASPSWFPPLSGMEASNEIVISVVFSFIRVSMSNDTYAQHIVQGLRLEVILCSCAFELGFI